jgi:hypothetical protein
MELATDHRTGGRRLIRLRSNRGRGRMVTVLLHLAPLLLRLLRPLLLLP